jgi:TolA-binding protein
MGDKFVTEELFEEAMNGLVSKEKFQSDIDCLVSGLTDVNKAITALTTQLKEHIKKADIDVDTLRQETRRLNTKIDNVQTQVLEKQGRFDKTSSSSSGGDSFGPLPPPVHKLRFPKYDGSEDPLDWLHKCEQFFCNQGTPSAQQV